jgi:hypothetical protein
VVRAVGLTRTSRWVDRDRASGRNGREWGCVVMAEELHVDCSITIVSVVKGDVLVRTLTNIQVDEERKEGKMGFKGDSLCSPCA